MKYGLLMISLLSMVNFLRKLSLVFNLFLLTLNIEFQYYSVSKGSRQIFHKIHLQFRRYDCEGGIVCIFTICIFRKLVIVIFMINNMIQLEYLLSVNIVLESQLWKLLNRERLKFSIKFLILTERDI